MSDRERLTTLFLDTTDWAAAKRAPLAGDASNRRYERLTDPVSGKTIVLMDAPPERGEDIRPFTKIGRYLTSIGLSAPKILAEDVQHGFLLIEDLGDDLFARIVGKKPGLETTLYGAAIDVLFTLHQAPLPTLKPYSPEVMTDLAALAFSKYRNGILDNSDGEAEFRTIFGTFCTKLEAASPVLIQRDYHAENLLWLPKRSGVARVGLLDFQDAMSGHPAYDLVSLLQDARRDVPKALEAEMIDRYIAASGANPEPFRSAYAFLGTQRNLRILGVFARLGREYHKPHYVDLIPRVWGLLMRDLEHPSLAPIADILHRYLPAPTPENLARLKTS